MAFDVYDKNDPLGTSLGTLTDAFDKKVAISLHGPGGGSFSIPRSSSQATAAVIQEGNLVKVRLTEVSATPLCAFYMEVGRFDLLSSNESGAETLTFGGKGVRAYLGRAILWAQSFLAEPDPVAGEWLLSTGSGGVYAGAILDWLIREAQAPGRPQDPVGLLTPDFTASVDSLSVAWPATAATAEYTAPVGQYLDEAVDQLVSAADPMVVQVEPDLHMKAYGSFGVDRTSGTFASGKVRLEKNVNIATALTRELAASPIKSHMLAVGDGVSGSASIGVTPVREGFLAAAGETSGTLDAVAAADLAARQVNNESVRVGIPFGNTPTTTGHYMPGPVGSSGHYWVGDTITLHTGAGAHDYNEAPIRVAEVSISEDAAGAPVTELALGSTYSGGITSQIAGELHFQQVVSLNIPRRLDDHTPPGPPTGLTLSSDVVNGPDGTPIVRLIVELTHPADGDYFGSWIEATRDNDGDDLAPQPIWDQPLKLLIGTENTKLAFEGVAGSTTYWVRAFAEDQSGNRSAYTSVVSITTSKDAVAPGQPQNVTALGGFRGIAISWSSSASADLMLHQVRWGIDDATWPELSSIRASVAWLPDLDPDTLYYLQVRAVDFSGNVVTSDVDSTPVDYLDNPDAGWTASVTATPSQVGTADIAASSITAVSGIIADLSADVITAGTLTLRPSGGVTALEIRDSGGALLASWDATLGITILGVDPSDYAIFDDGFLRFYKTGVLTAEIGPEGILAQSITLGVLAGGHNVVLNSSFELAGFTTGTGFALFTDSTGTPGWKAANRTTSPENMTEGTTLAPTTVSF